METTMPAQAPPQAVPGAPAAFSPLQRLILILLCGANCMVVLDFSIVNVAIPSIQKALGFAPGEVQWLFTGYGLVFGGFLLLGGRLSDLYGRKRVFLAGIVIFTTASFLGGMAGSPAALVAMRGLQGLGAALLAPSAMALLMGAFEEGPLRNRAFGIWGTLNAAGYSIGVVLGGVLVARLGWRWTLFVNVPLGLAVSLVAFRFLREPPRPRDRPKLDLAGSVLVTAGLMAVVFALSQAPARGWTAGATWRPLGAGLALLAAFAAVEARTAQPLLPPKLFLLPGMAAANLTSVFLAAALVAMNLLLTLYFQRVLGYSPLLTGLAFLPHGLAASLAGPWGGRLVGKVGARAVMVGGMVLVLAGMVLLSLITTRDTYWFHVMPVTILLSFGLMPAFVAITILATSGIRPEDHGLISGVLNTTGQLGGAMGVAALVAVAAAGSAHADAGLGEAGRLVAGYRLALGVAAGSVALALATAWFGLRKRAE